MVGLYSTTLPPSQLTNLGWQFGIFDNDFTNARDALTPDVTCDVIK